MRFARQIAMLSVAFAVVGACSTTTGYDGPRSPCSTGPASAIVAGRPWYYSSEDPGCIARCGDTSSARYGYAPPLPTMTALPAGACLYEGERCQMEVVYVCDNGYVGGESLFTCRCDQRKWECAAETGAGGCPQPKPLPPTDASTDG